MVAAQRQPPALASRQPSQRVFARRGVNCAYGDRAGAAAVRLIDAVDEQETRPAATEEEPARIACAAARLRLGERGQCGKVAPAPCLIAGGREGEQGQATGTDRTSSVWGKRVSGREDIDGSRTLKKNNHRTITQTK